VGLLNVVFAAHSGLWGVLVIDMIQFFVMMSAVLGAAWFAVKSVGGLDTLVAQVSSMAGPADRVIQGFNYLDVLPAFAPHNTDLWDLAVAVFLMPIAVQWWAVWYPGAEPGGGSYIAQRMLASKSERDALGGVLFFNIAHYVLRPWPWILVALASLVRFPHLADIQAAFPNLDPRWLGHDMAYPAMVTAVLPVGWLGLLVGGLIAANSSTILTHLNWGASYLVHDFYKRFVRPGESERHYVAAGRVATVGLFFCAAGMMYLMTTAKDAFDLILQIGAGTGLLYILRWFWWRVNAWCEVTAMVSSFLISIFFLVAQKQGLVLATSTKLVLTVLFTTVCWVAAAFVAPGTDHETLRNFYRKVKPFGPGWAKFRETEGLAAEPTTGENIPLALLGWLSGCATIWSSLFAVGNFLYGRTDYALACLAVFAVAAFVLVHVVRRLWNDGGEPAAV
jgi:Na+/proline symporter